MKMRKYPLALALGVLALSACTSSDVLEVEPHHSNAIGFDIVVNRLSRADVDTAVTGDLTKENFDKFLIYGYYTNADQTGHLIQVFGGDVVSKKGNTWTYANTRYWVPGATYHFFAYSCADVALNNTWGTPALNMNAVNSQDRVLRINDYICDRRHNHDLIYAETVPIIGKEAPKKEENATAPNNSAVSLSFRHLLSKLSVEFTSQFPGNYDVELQDVLIENFYNKASFNGTQWVDLQRVPENESTPIYYYFDFAKDEEGKDRNIATTALIEDGIVKSPAKRSLTSACYTIPYTYQQANVQLKFTLTLKKDGEVIMSRKMTGSWRPTWEIGKNYVYQITLTGTVANLEAIVFEVANDPVSGWTNGTGTGINMTFAADVNDTSLASDK